MNVETVGLWENLDCSDGFSYYRLQIRVTGFWSSWFYTCSFPRLPDTKTVWSSLVKSRGKLVCYGQIVFVKPVSQTKQKTSFEEGARRLHLTMQTWFLVAASYYKIIYNRCCSAGVCTASSTITLCQSYVIDIFINKRSITTNYFDLTAVDFNETGKFKF